MVLDPNTSLNGGKTKPLTKHARDQLVVIRQQGPIPRSELNPGVRDRLVRGAGPGLPYIEEINHTSPYIAHGGKTIAHVVITPAGAAELEGLQNG